MSLSNVSSDNVDSEAHDAAILSYSDSSNFSKDSESGQTSSEEEESHALQLKNFFGEIVEAHKLGENNEDQSKDSQIQNGIPRA